MKRSSCSSTRQSGFSLLELTVTLLLFSIMAGTLQLSVTRRLSQDLELDRLERVAGEVYRLASAAQHYEIEHGEWPGELLECDDAYQILDTAGLLKGAPLASPYLNAQGAAQHYVLSCEDATHFGIEVDTETSDQASQLAQKIPGSTADETKVMVHYPKGAGGILGGDYLPLDGSKSPTDTLDFGNQYVFGVRDVVSETGQTLLNSVQFVTAASSGDIIQKPHCPGDMQPRIFTALNHAQTPSGRAIHSIQLPAIDNGESWTLQAVISGSGGRESISISDATITAFVKCSY